MNKVIIITGASSGIGKSIGNYLTEKGYIVYGTSRKPEKYPKSEFTLVKSDINKKSDTQNLINHVISIEGKIDVLINNAGIGYTGPIEESRIEDIESLFSTNFFGPIEMIKNTLPLMRKNNSGLIINITSIAGYIGLPFRGVFCASKSALEILTESLRAEIKDYGIKVVNVAPGDVKTDVISRRIDSFNDKNSIYFKKYYKTWKSMNKDVEEGGIDPLKISRLIFKIINKNNPKIHYVIGKPLQKFSIVLKKILPDLVFERILNRFNSL
ncbi:MAG: SDR family NAD(P)-dependent oxidoreductase [Cryomorphaceae bacterium]|nr:MAG: SDR family NAD(P)-dependent oxidoreductase [Cryomorphaceae bacterium]